MTLRYLSICSGIEAATVAWEPLGFRPVGFSEIEAFPSEVLAHRYGSNMPGEELARNGVPNHGDFTTIDPAAIGPVDLLVGGTPCQAFSIAGNRLSLADARGNLSLSYVVLAHGLADNAGLRNALWENVPGVLSTADNAFGCFVGALVGADDAILPAPRPPEGRSTALWRWRPAGRYPVLDDDGEPTGDFNEYPALHIPLWPREGMAEGPRGRAAWRILDAQYFGLAQRRKRVFLVYDPGGGADPAQVLFERQGLHGNSAPRREARQGAAAFAGGGAAQRLAFGGNNTRGPIDVATAVFANGGGQAMDFEMETFVAESAPTLSARTKGGGGLGTDFDLDGGMVAHALRGEGFDASEDGTGRGTPIVPVVLRGHSDYGAGLPCLRAEGGDIGGGSEVLVPVLARTLTRGAESAGKGGYAGRRREDDSNLVAYAIQERAVCENPAAGPDGLGVREDVAFTLEALPQVQAIAFDMRGREGGAMPEGPHDTANIRAASGGSSRSYVATPEPRWAVRRLTPRECERLQGFPDDYTAIPRKGRPAAECPDGPRYKALGNSMAVPVMAWIGARIAEAMPRTP